MESSKRELNPLTELNLEITASLLQTWWYRKMKENDCIDWDWVYISWWCHPTDLVSLLERSSSSEDCINAIINLQSTINYFDPMKAWARINLDWSTILRLGAGIRSKQAQDILLRHGLQGNRDDGLAGVYLFQISSFLSQISYTIYEDTE